jgi:hypothetical protein
VSEFKEFEVGDLVVLSPFSGDFAKSHNALYDIFDFENDLKTIALMSDRKGGEVRSSTQHLRLATKAEFEAGHRIDTKQNEDIGDDFPIENRISPHCKAKDV